LPSRPTLMFAASQALAHFASAVFCVHVCVLTLASSVAMSMSAVAELSHLGDVLMSVQYEGPHTTSAVSVHVAESTELHWCAETRERVERASALGRFGGAGTWSTRPQLAREASSDASSDTTNLAERERCALSARGDVREGRLCCSFSAATRSVTTNHGRELGVEGVANVLGSRRSGGTSR